MSPEQATKCLTDNFIGWSSTDTHSTTVDGKTLCKQARRGHRGEAGEMFQWHLETAIFQVFQVRFLEPRGVVVVAGSLCRG